MYNDLVERGGDVILFITHHNATWWEFLKYIMYYLRDSRKTIHIAALAAFCVVINYRVEMISRWGCGNFTEGTPRLPECVHTRMKYSNGARAGMAGVG